MVSDIPIVKGDGPLDEPNAPTAVLNSKLPILSALFMVYDGLILPLPGKFVDIMELEEAAEEAAATISERLEGGLGMAILLADVGVGICRLFDLDRLAEAGAEALASPNSEKMSPNSAYL